MQEIKINITPVADGFLDGSPMRIGYARVSTPDQSLELQKDSLASRRLRPRVFTDVASGKSAARPGLDRAREQLRAGDVFVVWRLDRLGRSLRHLIDSLSEFEAAGVGFSEPDRGH